MSPSKVIQLALLCVVSIGAAYLAFLGLDSQQAVHVVKNYGYWLMLLNVVVLLALLFREYRLVLNRSCAMQWARGHWHVLVFILLSGLVTQLIQPHGYKITMDEPVLSATALRMHEYKEVMVTARAHEINGVYRQLDGFVDKRPFFFPFLVSILHDCIGFNSVNPMLLNGALSILFLALLFFIGQRCWPVYGGYFAVLLILTLPLFSMSATGAGFGVLNLVMILATALAGIAYLKDPQIRSMNILIFMGLLLAQTRYESVLFVLPVALIVMMGWLKKRKLQLSWLTICAPILMVPYGLQRVIFDDSAQAFELREGATEAFSLAYIPSNLMDAAAFFFNVSTSEYPNSVYLSSAFLFAALLLILGLLRKRWSVDLKSPELQVWFGFSLVIIFNFFLLMSYHWGQLNDIMATRIALPFILFQVLVCALLGRHLFKRQQAVAALFIATVCFFFAFTIPSTAKNDYLQWVPGRHEAVWVQEQSKALEERNVLMISNTHLMSVIERVPTIAQFWAKNNKARLKLHLDLKTYEAIYVVHMMVADPDAESGMIPATPVYHDYQLETVVEEKLGERRYIRMSRLIDVHLLEGEQNLLETIKVVPETDLEKLAFIAETLP